MSMRVMALRVVAAGALALASAAVRRTSLRSSWSAARPPNRLLKAQTALGTRHPTSIRNAQLHNDPSGLPRSTAYYDPVICYGASGSTRISVLPC